MSKPPRMPRDPLAGLIYVASPYSHPDAAVRAWRAREAARYCARLARCGALFFSPITMCHPLTEFGVPGDAEFWLRFDRAYLERCDRMHLLALPGWFESRGVTGERLWMYDAGKPVHYVHPGRDYPWLEPRPMHAA